MKNRQEFVKMLFYLGLERNNTKKQRLMTRIITVATQNSVHFGQLWYCNMDMKETHGEKRKIIRNAGRCGDGDAN